MMQQQNLPGMAILRFTGIMLVGFGLINLVTQLISLSSLNMAAVFQIVPILGCGVIFGISGGIWEVVSGAFALAWGNRADRGFQLIIFGIVLLAVILLGNVFTLIGLRQISAQSSSPAILVAGILWPILLIIGGVQNRKPLALQTPHERTDNLKKNMVTLGYLKVGIIIIMIFALVMAVVRFVLSDIFAGIFYLGMTGFLVFFYYINNKQIKTHRKNISDNENQDKEKTNVCGIVSVVVLCAAIIFVMLILGSQLPSRSAQMQAGDQISKFSTLMQTGDQIITEEDRQENETAQIIRAGELCAIESYGTSYEDKYWTQQDLNYVYVKVPKSWKVFYPENAEPLVFDCHSANYIVSFIVNETPASISSGINEKEQTLEDFADSSIRGIQSDGGENWEIGQVKDATVGESIPAVRRDSTEYLDDIKYNLEQYFFRSGEYYIELRFLYPVNSDYQYFRIFGIIPFTVELKTP